MPKIVLQILKIKIHVVKKSNIVEMGGDGGNPSQWVRLQVISTPVAGLDGGRGIFIKKFSHWWVGPSAYLYSMNNLMFFGG